LGVESGSGLPNPQPPTPNPLAGRRVLALSSLGNPQGFEELLSEAGAEVVSARYPDHHRYCAEELRREAERAQDAGCSMVVTTEKDAVKIEPGWIADVPLWVLPVEIEFDAGQEALESLVEAAVK
jgi:tetraacyldisaccharide-1-P 4'-kinase